MALARIGNITVVKVLSQVIEDLVRGTVTSPRPSGGGGALELVLPAVCVVLPGEFMQLGSKENENERFKHYLEKTFKKTASLIANSCKAVCTFLLQTNEPRRRRRRRASPGVCADLFFHPRSPFW